MRYFFRNRQGKGRQPAYRRSRLVFYGAIATGTAVAIITSVSLTGGRPTAATGTNRHTGLFAVHPLPCGAAGPGPVGTVVRLPATVADSPASLAAQGVGFPVAVLARTASTTLYVGPLGAALSPTHPASTQFGVVAVPSARPLYSSCNYQLGDSVPDQRFKAAAEQAFLAAGLVTTAQLDGQGVIWMVADDPTSSSDELVAVDIETPMTSSSPGTIGTLVAAVDPSSTSVLGVAAAAHW